MKVVRMNERPAKQVYEGKYEDTEDIKHDSGNGVEDDAPQVGSSK